MYAVIETGGKQYRVEVGTELEVELLEVAAGDAITLDRVLLVADGDTAEIGRPTVPNATVAAEVLRQIRGEKTISFKYRPKARSRVKKGHRQELTVLRISDIVLGGRSAAADAAKAVEAKVTERQRLEAVAKRQAEADAELAAKLAPPKPKAETASTKAGSTKPGSTKAGSTKATKATKAQKASTPATRTSAASAAKSKASTTATKSTTPAAAKATKVSAIPADKPKRARAPKKDE